MVRRHRRTDDDGIAAGQMTYSNQAAAWQEGGANVDELRRVFEQAQQQPSDVQLRIAELVALELEGHTQDALVGSPQGQETLERLAARRRKRSTVEMLKRAVGGSVPVATDEAFS